MYVVLQETPDLGPTRVRGRPEGDLREYFGGDLLGDGAVDCVIESLLTHHFIRQSLASKVYMKKHDSGVVSWCRGVDRLLTVAPTHSTLFISVATADNHLTNNRMTAIMILFSCANISD